MYLEFVYTSRNNPMNRLLNQRATLAEMSLTFSVMVVILTLTVIQEVSGQSSAGYDYPLATAATTTNEYHGFEVADPYQWMEDVTSKELNSWIAAQEQFRQEWTANGDFVNKLAARIESVSAFASRSVPGIRGARLFYIDSAEGESYGRLLTEPIDGTGSPALLIDFEEMRADGSRAYVSSYSADGRFLTYETTEGQGRWMTLHVRDVEANRDLPEAFTGIYSGRSTVAWTTRGDGFFYTTYEVPADPQAQLGNLTLRYHRLGDKPANDRKIFEEEDVQMSYSLRVTHDGRYLILTGSRSGGSFNGLDDSISYIDLESDEYELRNLFDGEEGKWAFEGSDGPVFRLRTTNEADNVRIVEVDVDKPARANWREIVPESDAVIQNVSEIGDKLVVRVNQDGGALARIYNLDGTMERELDIVAPSFSGFPDNRESSRTFFSAPTLYDPGTIYTMDVSTGATEVYYRAELNHDPADFVTRQVFFESKDGSRVPMWVVHRADVFPDGERPVFLYGYGAWAWFAFPWQRHLIPWMEAGGIYAVANVRGGGEYGDSWHAGGQRLQKQNTIDDFIAAAEWFVDSGYTKPDLIAANGGSASGFLPAAAINQRPGLFGASVINFPVMDMLRYDNFGSAKSWIPEYGTVSNPEDFRVLRSYSPYHNLESGRCYPPTWVQVGDKDETTTPMHGYKYVAALQRAQGCDSPVILKTAFGAGHSYGLTPEQRYKTQAEELAFLFQVMNLPYELKAHTPN